MLESHQEFWYKLMTMRAYAACVGAMLATVLTVGAAPAAAQTVEPIQLERPGDADWPNLVPPGYLQIELAIRGEREDDGDEGADEITVPKPLVRLGLNEWVELRIETDGFVYRIPDEGSSTSNAADLVLGSKLHLFDQSGWRPLASLLLNLGLPTGSSDVTSDGVDPEVKLLLGWEREGGPHTTLNLGYLSETQGSDDSARVSIFETALSLEFPVTDRLAFFAEYFADIKGSGKPDLHGFDGGITFLLTPNLMVDLSGGGNVSNPVSGWFAEAGVAWRHHLWTW